MATTADSSNDRLCEPEQEPPARILLVTSHGLLRAGLESYIRQEPDLCMVGHAETTQAATELAAALLPDVVIVEHDPPAVDAPAVTVQVRERRPSTRVVGVVLHKAPELAEEMRTAGATACLGHTAGMTALLAVLRRGE